MNLETNNQYSAGTQFDKDQSLPAVDAFLQEIIQDHASFETVPLENKQRHVIGWCVTATLNGGSSLPYTVYAPWAGGGTNFIEGRLQNLSIEDKDDAVKCVPCWSSGNLYKLNFVFYMDGDKYKLSTIYPVYDKDKGDSLFKSKSYTPSSEVLDRSGFDDEDDEDDGALAKKKYPNYYSANLEKAKKRKQVLLGCF